MSYTSWLFDSAGACWRGAKTVACCSLANLTGAVPPVSNFWSFPSISSADSMDTPVACIPLSGRSALTSSLVRFLAPA